MSDWPPAADSSTVWTTVHPLGGEPTRVRPVRLWGEDVLINADALVWCDGCRQFLEATELSRPDNAHRVGLPPRHGAVLPMTGDEAAAAEPSIMDLQW
jgi:hypothetical protein